MTAQAPIEIQGLIKDYGALRAVNNVSFSMKPGEIFGLLGPNGAGKTSIISTIVTLEEPTQGRVRVFGLDVTEHPKETKFLTGFVPQELIHHGYFDVEEILEFHSGYFGRRANAERIRYLLDRLGLFEHRKKKVKQLSGGMKRRLLIAKALVNEPKLLLLDEPTAGVDIELRTSLWKFVGELKSQGMSILLTTHYIQEAEELCDRVAILQAGQIKAIGETKNLVRGLTQREVSITLQADRSEFSHPGLVSRRPNPTDASLADVVLRVPTEKPVGSLLGEIGVSLGDIKDMSVREGSLEDALRKVLQEGSQNV